MGGGVYRVISFGLVIFCLVTSGWSATVHVYVSPEGDDSNDGHSTSHPIKTLNQAVKLLHKDGIRSNSVFVELMQGYHDLTSTLHIQNVLGSTVVFRAYQGQEVHVTGGKRLPSSQFHHVTDADARTKLPQEARDKVLELDLSALGITDLGELRTYGWFVPVPVAPLEITINGEPLRLAEWPNAPGFINIKSMPDGRMGYRFTYDAAGRDVNWAKETEPWGYGFWHSGYADFSQPFAHVFPENHTIFFKSKPRTGMIVGHWDPSKQITRVQGGYFRVINMLCELDRPGEYYVDRSTKKLYVWPNTPHETLTSSDVVYASMIDECIKMEGNAQNFHFEDFTLENCRHHGFELNDARLLTIKNLDIRNMGGSGVHCTGDCRSISVLASDIHDVNGGVFLKGGDRTHLISSKNEIRDNHIWSHSRLAAFPNHGIYLEGVNTIVSHNHLHHGQYAGIWWIGNDHVMEYNHVHHMCLNASDCGAFHSLRDWTLRGNVIRKNHVHNTVRLIGGNPVRAIMLDDQYSSALIEGNVFYDNDIHVNIGGGRDTVVRYNVLYHAYRGSVGVDGRGLKNHHNNTLVETLEKSPYRTPLWKSRYPELYNILDKDPMAPEGNQIYNNVFYNRPGVERINEYAWNRPEYYYLHDNYVAYYERDFTAPASGDYTLRCEAADWASKTNFPRPPTLQEVGPTVPTGPHYLTIHRPTAVHTTPAPSPCDRSTVAPAGLTPGHSYIPDGTAPNTLYPNVSKTGCWLIIDHCPAHRTAEGQHKDEEGSRADTEEACLARAAQQWKWCGAPDNGRVTAVYGPTGAMTFSTKGCYIAYYRRGDAKGIIELDTDNASATSESHCLGRSATLWFNRGRPLRYPYTSVYGPTGALRTAGRGCWIKINACPAKRDLEGYFYDAWGETNRLTGTEEPECFERAKDFWTQCGSHQNAPVTAYFRPKGASHTVP